MGQTKWKADKDGKLFYKLMSNAVYGKAMAKVRNRVDRKLVNNKKNYLKWTSKPSHGARKMVAIHKIKTTITLKKPAYFGMCILELSKVPILEFRYDYIKNKYGNKSRLLFKNIDRLMYEIKIKNIKLLIFHLMRTADADKSGTYIRNVLEIINFENSHI